MENHVRRAPSCQVTFQLTCHQWNKKPRNTPVHHHDTVTTSKSNGPRSCVSHVTFCCHPSLLRALGHFHSKALTQTRENVKVMGSYFHPFHSLTSPSKRHGDECNAYTHLSLAASDFTQVLGEKPNVHPAKRLRSGTLTTCELVGANRDTRTRQNAFFSFPQLVKHRR